MDFGAFLEERLRIGGFTTEDVLASFLPLVRQVVAAHEAKLVAPLEGIEQLRVEGTRIWFEQGRLAKSRQNASRVRELLKPQSRAVEIVGHERVTDDIGGEAAIRDLSIAERGAEITRPVYLPGYVSWEHEIGHHDPLTDVFSLGLVLASLSCALDLRDKEDLKRFVKHRSNLFALSVQLHPVLARAAVRMTELDRHRRPQDLRGVLRALENYREQNVDLDLELARSGAFRETNRKTRQQLILNALKQRLFEISRRNRLLHFHPTMQTVNLTLASVPLAFAVESIRQEEILTWNAALQSQLASGEPVSLNRHLRFDEALYLPGTLDRIAAEARREQAEFGFSQLRLAISFLRWSNLKEKPPERFDSPLLLVPVRLTKKKGVRDTWLLEATEDQIEVNPVLRQHLKQLYDLDLPERLDLTAANLDDFYAFLIAKVRASEPAVEIEKIDRPKIKIIHALARRRLDQYQKRLRLSGRGVRTCLDVDYSYDAENYHPLGLALFRSRIKPPATNVRTLIEERPRPRTFMAAPLEGAIAEKERMLFELVGDEGTNPYHWQFDLCHVTLGSFRYRKLSLVRDYEVLLEDGIENPACDAIFSDKPRPVEPVHEGPVPLADRFEVVPCDPTQASSIARARAGTSYIIQGPPGTGKSQTITNLIADFLGRGKRVLFVCEKRAAIDVVYHRLRSIGLERLCCLIHDSQLDKRDFVLDLKRTYEEFLAEGERPPQDPLEHRAQLVETIDRELAALSRYYDALSAAPAAAGTTVRSLLQQALRLSSVRPRLDAARAERVPKYALWHEHAEAIERFGAALQEIQPDGVFLNHPLRFLSARLLAQQRPVERVSQALARARGLLSRVQKLLASAGPASAIETLADARALAQYVERVEGLARHDLLSVLQSGTPAAKRLESLGRKFRAAEKKLRAADEEAAGWKKRLPPADAKLALEQAVEFEQNLFRFLRPAWWRLRRIVNSSYDFSGHVVRPAYGRVLGWLCAAHAARGDLEQLESEARTELGFEGPFSEWSAGLAELKRGLEERPAAVQALHRHCLSTPADGGRLITEVAGLRSLLEELRTGLEGVLEGFDESPLADVAADFSRIDSSLEGLPDFLVCLGALGRLPSELAVALRTLPLTLKQLEAASAEATLSQVFRSDRELDRFDGRVREEHIARLERSVASWREVNAAVVCEQVRRRFLENVRITSLPAGQMERDQKELKKRYQRGRRELEHEFGKTMRYRSIRDLASDETGLLVNDLKPVWLMSPLSVSDTLPLGTDQFDVVIFDEASQITLEEAVPTIFRGSQAIVVGDQMQLPPTNFFSARRTDDEESLQFAIEPGQPSDYDLSSDSLLEHAARKLSSTTLGWHYRSRSESLIGFSNAAFYQGRLLTVPEESLAPPGRGEIVVNGPGDGGSNAERLFERALSFHFLPAGVYERRRNASEASYIAQLVRGILRRATGKSIGIVAFSEAQQSEINEALERLAQEDRAFRELYEAECQREEDDQFLGLLVKNLENIQGDERDIVILSVCYGYDPNRRMLMNFGPINQSGGEKRLNVAFSRAKHHMAVVSSIRQQDITNEYNDGANCLKNYLRYAEASSAGDSAASARVLAGYSPALPGQPAGAKITPDVVAEQLAESLAVRGFKVDRNVGQSRLRCDLAVYQAGDPAYRLGILVDTDEYYRQSDILEKDLMRPRLLEEFGWKIERVLTKDWHRDPDAILEKLLRRLDT